MGSCKYRNLLFLHILAFNIYGDLRTRDGKETAHFTTKAHEMACRIAQNYYGWCTEQVGSEIIAYTTLAWHGILAELAFWSLVPFYFPGFIEIRSEHHWYSTN
jgi:hypothetical protein